MQGHPLRRLEWPTSRHRLALLDSRTQLATTDGNRPLRRYNAILHEPITATLNDPDETMIKDETANASPHPGADQ
jgi:hypothetical protein